MNTYEIEEQVVGIYANQMRKDWNDYLTPQNRRLARLAIFRLAGEEMKGVYLEHRKEGCAVHDAFDLTFDAIDQFAEQMKQTVRNAFPQNEEIKEHHNG